MQKSLFSETQDISLLPLFSETAQHGKIDPFAPKPKAKQETIPVNCNACMDTGNIGGKSCWCKSELNQRNENVQSSNLGYKRNFRRI
jgi:hypothetical protein